MGRNEFISISDSNSNSRALKGPHFWVGKFGGKQGGEVLRPARHPDWASCAFLGAL